MEPMILTPEQKQAIAGWVAAGDNLFAVQKKLNEEFKLSLTYMDVRFLVDDLNLQLKDAAPKADPNSIGKPVDRPAAKKGFFDKAKEKLGLSRDEGGAGPEPEADAAGDFDEAEPGNPPLADGARVSISVDKLTLIPGALASGTVTFTDGVTGKWIVDNYGRPGFTEISRPGYRPSPADSQSFMEELNLALQKKGL